jgi:hypothetical protein
MAVEWAQGCFVRFREVDRGTPVTEMVKVSGRRPSQVAGLGTGRRTETAHVRTRGQRAMRLWGFEDFRAVVHTLRAQRRGAGARVVVG